MKCLIALGCWGLLYAQSVSIPPGDPDVFVSFLRMHHAMLTSKGETGSSTTATASSTATTAGSPAAPGWQHELGLSDKDFSQIEPAYLALKTQLDALHGEASAYAAAHPTSPDSAVLNAFRNRELALINNAVASLKGRLSPAGAAALFGFLDGKFRASVNRAPVGKNR